MKKVLMFIGGRSNYGRLYQLAKTLHEHPDFEVYLILACSAANVKVMPLATDMPGKVVQLIEADMYHDVIENMTTTMSLVAMQISNHLLNNCYDVAICHGDRFETLGFAVACSYGDLPLVHMESGEYSGNIDNKIRWAISSLADLQLAPTQKSHDNLKAVDLFNSYFVGSPAVEYILRNKDRLKHWAGNYIMAVYNPTPSKEFEVFLDFVTEISKKTKVYWVNPNIDPGNKYIVKTMHKMENKNANIIFTKNLLLDDYLELMINCTCLIGNTSSGLKEAAALEKPYILLPGRQKNRECGENVYLASHKQVMHEIYEYIKGGSYRAAKYEGQFGNLETCNKCIDFINRFIFGG